MVNEVTRCGSTVTDRGSTLRQRYGTTLVGPSGRNVRSRARWHARAFDPFERAK